MNWTISLGIASVILGLMILFTMLLYAFGEAEQQHYADHDSGVNNDRD